jgi:hypothetical protein
MEWVPMRIKWVANSHQMGCQPKPFSQNVCDWEEKTNDFEASILFCDQFSSSASCT